MAYKLLNKTRKDFNLKDVKDDKELYNFIEAIKQGEYEIVPNWDYVDKLLEIFPDNENWLIEQLSSGMFAILPENTTTFQKHQFEKLLAE